MFVFELHYGKGDVDAAQKTAFLWDWREVSAERESGRGNGVGRALCEHAMAAMRDAGVEVVELGTGGDDFHGPARALYESLGFHLVAVTGRSCR